MNKDCALANNDSECPDEGLNVKVEPNCLGRMATILKLGVSALDEDKNLEVACFAI
jgi:hypothetical protein